MYKKYLDRFLLWLTPLKKEPPGLPEAVNEAKRAWKQALHDLNFVDSSLIDYAVHHINATERRYMALIDQAKREGVTAWPGHFEDNDNPVAGETKPGESSHHKQVANF